MKTPALTELADALVSAAPTLDAHGRAIAKAIYKLLANGAPITDDDVATETGIPLDRVVSTIGTWNGVYRNPDRQIIGFWGLTVTEMPPHRFQVGAANMYAWCALDTLFLPAVLGATANVESTDASSGETVTLTVTAAGVTRRSHEQMVVSFVMPKGEFTDDVVQSFCHYVHFFTDPDSARQWTDTHEHTFTVPLDEAFDIGHRWNEARQI